jgi:hypothetical protein
MGLLLKDGHTRWHHCIDMLKSGIKEKWSIRKRPLDALG